MKMQFLSLLAISLFWAFSAWALDLHQARSDGSVGEKADGYVAAIKSSAEVNQLVAQVNAKRQAEYSRISKENGQPVDVVAKLAAAQIIGKLRSGEMYQNESGSWVSR